MRQIALKRKFVAMLGHKHSPVTAQSSGEWDRIRWWRRLFLPSDFSAQVECCGQEIIECRRYLTEYLSVREKRRFATLRVGDTQNYRRDLDYCPEEFKNQRITFLENEEKVSCGRCKGQGRIDCSPQMPCPNCRGRRTRKDFCFSCGGSGRSAQDGKEVCWTCGGRGIRSDGCAACADVFSGSTGRVRCNRCGGLGWVLCRRCAGAGAKVRVKLVTRIYSRSAEDHFQLGGLKEDEFLFGLDPKDFMDLPGNPAHQQVQTPQITTVVLQRVSVFNYGVESRNYRYKGVDSYLYRIQSTAGTRWVTSNLPWSKPKLASIGTLIAMAVLVITGLLFAA